LTFRAEDFFLRDLHVVLNVGENGGLDEVPLSADTVAPPATSLAFFFLSGVEVAPSLCRMILVDLRPCSVFVSEGCHGALFGAFCVTFFQTNSAESFSSTRGRNRRSSTGLE